MKTRLVFTSYCRATTDTDAPGADAAATISRFSASGHTFRRTRALVSIIGLVDTYHPADTERPEPIQNSKIQAGGPYRRDTVRAEFDTNFFGALSVIQTVLPLLRRQGSGHILGVSSVAGVNATPVTGFYNASKWAFEALHESLSKEVARFGLKVTIIEPGAYATEFGSQSSLKISAGIDAYADIRAQLFAYGATVEFGEPQATLSAILKIVDAEQPPLRIFLGTEGLPVAREAYAERLALWQEWETTSNAAQGAPRKQSIDLK